MAGHRFVSFLVGEHLMGVNIGRVDEVSNLGRITPVPHSEPHIRGLLNLRGRVLAVFDMGARLGLDPLIVTPASACVVLKNEDAALLVDWVGEVIECPEEDLEPAPANIKGIDRRFVGGIVALRDELLLILSVNELVA